MNLGKHFGRSTHQVLVAALEGEVCPVTPSCGGILRDGTYKDQSALVCDVCGTPATRVWEQR